MTDNIKCQPLSQTKIKVNGCEDVWVELTLENNDTLIVGSVYRHPNSTISDLRTFEDAFVSIIKSKIFKNFNIHNPNKLSQHHRNILVVNVTYACPTLFSLPNPY